MRDGRQGDPLKANTQRLKMHWSPSPSLLDTHLLRMLPVGSSVYWLLRENLTECSTSPGLTPGSSQSQVWGSTPGVSTPSLEADPCADWDARTGFLETHESAVSAQPFRKSRALSWEKAQCVSAAAAQSMCQEPRGAQSAADPAATACSRNQLSFRCHAHQREPDAPGARIKVTIMIAAIY